MKLHHVATLFLAVAAAEVRAQSAAPAETVYEAGAVTVLPKPLNQPEFVQAMNNAYPQALRDAGMPGTVQVRFVIGTDGAPRDFEVTASSAAFLNAPAIEALSVLRFSPAELNGRPVPMWAELPVQWQPAAPVGPGLGDTVRIYEIREVDREPTPANVSSLVRELERLYPPALRDAGIQGEVSVGMRISPEGVPHALTIVDTSHPDFVEPTLAAVRSLRFRPAEVDGKPVWVWVCIPVQWRVGNQTFFGSPRPSGPGGRRGPVAVEPVVTNPEVLRTAMAAATAELRGSPVRWGRVVVRFRVGTDGVPDEVRVAQGADRRLNELSIRIVQQLRFHPATLDGRLVVVPMQLPIDWVAP